MIKAIKEKEELIKENDYLQKQVKTNISKNGMIITKILKEKSNYLVYQYNQIVDLTNQRINQSISNPYENSFVI